VRKHRIYSWNQRDNAPETKYLEVAGKDWQSAQPNTLEYTGACWPSCMLTSRLPRATA